MYFPVHCQLHRLPLNETPPDVQTKKERENMSEAKPKMKGAKKFCRPMRAAGQPTKKEFVVKVVGLESHTFSIGNAKYAAKYKKTVDAIANYKPTLIAKAIKALSLPTLQVPGYPKTKAGETAVNPGEVYIWQQDIATVKKQINQIEENKKHAYVLVIGQYSPNLKHQGKPRLIKMSCSSS
jgi:hypothetical protein